MLAIDCLVHSSPLVIWVQRGQLSGSLFLFRNMHSNYRNLVYVALCLLGIDALGHTVPSRFAFFIVLIYSNYMSKKKPKPAPMPINEVEEINAQNRLAKMLKQSGYQSKFLEKLADKRED
jgi:hypothetical protein